MFMFMFMFMLLFHTHTPAHCLPPHCPVLRSRPALFSVNCSSLLNVSFV
jgi:hypothetical protein